MTDLSLYLKEHSYPGRGLVFGTAKNGEFAVVAYFIMGRSKNSRNRIFVEDNKGIRTKAYDESEMIDPSLVIYSPVRVCGNILIASNGDQTDTIYEYIRHGHSFEDALRTRSFEPDPPIYTPRISGIMDLASGAYRMSILKPDESLSNQCARYFYEYEPHTQGEGHFISTYATNGDPPPLFSGEPIAITVPDKIDQLTSCIWESLNKDYKVSLFTRYIDLNTKEYETRIVNINQ